MLRRLQQAIKDGNFMMDFFAGIIEYFASLLWAGITNALWLNPQVFEVVEQSQQSRWVVAGIVFLAGASTLLGQSAVLFINRVRRSRFVISLITNGIIFIISYVVWGVTVWLIGRVLFRWIRRWASSCASWA